MNTGQKWKEDFSTGQGVSFDFSYYILFSLFFNAEVDLSTTGTIRAVKKKIEKYGWRRDAWFETFHYFCL